MTIYFSSTSSCWQVFWTRQFKGCGDGLRLDAHDTLRGEALGMRQGHWEHLIKKKMVVQCNGGPTFLAAQESLNACSKSEEAFNEMKFE